MRLFHTFLVSFLSFTFFMLSHSVHSQNTDAIWEALHTNNRKEALKKAQKLDRDSSIEALLTNAIVRVENGLLTPEEDFVDKFMNFPDAEYYLYSQWFSTYLFGDYLKTGFDSFNTRAVDHIDDSKFLNPTIKNSTHYLKAIVARYRKDWITYEREMNKINAIQEWEYCGVFENLNNSGLATVYEPEHNSSLAAEFDTRGNGLAHWYKRKIINEAYNFFTNHYEYGSGVNYAQTFITAEEPTRVHLKIGHGGLFKLFVNDVLIVQEDNDIITEMDAITYAVTLQQGANRIVIKSATEKQTPYFILRIEDEKGNVNPKVNVDLQKREYKTSSIDQLNPVLVPHSINTYFESKQQEVGENYLLDQCLYNSYLRNSMYDEALNIINIWLKKYPQSATLLTRQAECLLIQEKETRYNEVKRNIEVKHPDYFESVLTDMQDFDQLMKLDLDDYNKKLDRISKAIDYPYLSKTIDLFKIFRTNDLKKLKEQLDILLVDTTLPSSIKPTFIQFYSQVLNDDESTIIALENLVNETYNYSAISLLKRYYKKQNKVDQSLNVYKEVLDNFNYDNNTLYTYVDLLQSYNKFEESIPYIEIALENFPDSYKFLKLMGLALQQTGKKKEALAYYEKAIERNGADRSLRTLILDLKGEKDPLEQFKIDDAYDYVKNHRNQITKNNYGFNILLDQIDVLKYKENGGRYQGTYIYEITSQQGVDQLKEYNLGLYGDYVIYKSEIIRPDNSIVPADRSGSNMVFNGLSVGDVIYIDYETTFSRSGRFYEHYQDSKSFSNYHPLVNKTYRVLTKKEEMPINYTTANGNLEPKIYSKGSYKVYEWIQEGKTMLPQYEDYMPVFEDISTELHISTIKNWSEISDWYSDLVRNQIEYDDTVNEAFESIFPDGYKQLSQDVRAKKIYDYITSSFSYSYVSFKQSGFVPQKPAKVIDTKLGDCKDFSTLYLTLAKQAELDANLVLILTSDYGEQSLILPSTDFNHCIIRVKIDEKYQYLELTSKYLPYKALPISLINATALEIPFSKGDMPKNSIKTLSNLDRKQAVLLSEASVKVGLDKSIINLKTETSGSLSTSYIQRLTENANKEKLEKSLFEEISNRNYSDFTLLSVGDKEFSNKTDVTSYEMSLQWNEKPNSVGSLRTLEIPYFANPYNQGVISLEKREYPINYIQYENADVYKETVTLLLEDGQQFVEVPQSASYTFKNHSYKVTYEQPDDKTLRVITYSETPLDDILPKDYSAFRSYVQNVLESRRQLIGFK